MLTIRDLSLPPAHDRPEPLRRAAAKRLGVPVSDLQDLKVLRRSIDARKKEDVRLIYTVSVSAASEASLSDVLPKGVSRAEPTAFKMPEPKQLPMQRPVVVGFGPAGMFASLTLAEAGMKPLVLERGQPVEQRSADVQRLREQGLLDPESNVQFGEGGAGTFSDGKLNTGIGGSKVDYILRRFVEFGAQKRILWDALPHMGTDVLRTVVRRIRERILALGGEIRFGARMEGLISKDGRLQGVCWLEHGIRQTVGCDALFLAIGHSAQDTQELLFRSGIPMEAKPFSMGVRIEHLQKEIDRAQLGRFAGHPSLGAASYRLAVHPDGSDGVYTFCMCPGGYVMAAASEAGGVVTNGMSYSGRAGENANAALLATLPVSRFPDRSVLGGIRWKRELEQAAYRLAGGGYAAPAQRLSDFLDGRASSGAGRIQPSYLPGVAWRDLHDCLPSVITTPLAAAIPLLERRLHGFGDGDAVLTGPETRSSSPIRMLRNEAQQSIGLLGLYPCGEGAGWAGGIVSAAADALRCVEAYFTSL